MTATRPYQALGTTGATAPRMTRRAFLRRFGLGGLAAGLASALVALPIAYTGRLDGRILHGVSIGGVAVGGLTAEEAAQRLAARFTAYRAQEVRVLLPVAGREWRVAPAALDVQADIAGSATQALTIGRAGRALALAPLALLVRGAQVPLPVTLDGSRLEALLTEWADGVTAPPVDARFTRAADGGLTIIPERAGPGFDPAAAHPAVVAHAARLGTDPLPLQLVPIAPAVTAGQLTASAAQVAAWAAQPFTLTDEGRRWTLDPDTLLAALVYRPEGATVRPTLEPAALRPFLAPVATAVARAPVEATIARDEAGHYAIVPEQAGQALDEAATVAAMAAALRDERREAAVVLGAQAPAVTAATLTAPYEHLDRVLNTPLRVAFAEYQRVLTRDDIAPLVTIAPGGANGTPAALQLDPAGVRALATALATDLDQEARDAVFAWRDGAVRETTAAQDGRAVQVEPTATALETAILGAAGTVTPVVTVTPPSVPASAAEAIVITDRLGGGRSDYSWSVPNRKFNVELAIQRLDGALVAPGATFSFNASVGEQTIENGYKEGYGIALVGGTIGGGGEVKTVTSIGGGICQVSTILFQVVYRAGLPLEERNWHLYWIPGYGAAPSGLQGLDATVDSASGLDFKFRNTTGNWLAIEAVADGAEVRIALHGVDPGWDVAVADPIITNPRPADPTPQLEKTHDLAPGAQVAVEHAVDGFDAANHVRVTDKSGQLVREATFTSNYYPSRNVTQVGVAANEPLS
jgi:vancomycin resistance protein YoaR